MGWDAISAIGSIVAATVLLVATVAALIQLKHLRLANQIGSYIEIMRHMNSREMVEARTYAESHDFENPETVRKALEGGLDDRLFEWGGYYQMLAEYLVYTSDRSPINVKRYDAKFREAIKLEPLRQEWVRQAGAVTGRTRARLGA